MTARKPIVSNTGDNEQLQGSDDLTLGNRSLLGINSAQFNGEYLNGNSGTGLTINWANGALQRVTWNAATPTMTLSTPPGPGRYQLIGSQDATGGRLPTWAGSAYSASRWGGATAAPAVNTAALAETIVSFYFDGTNLYQTMYWINGTVATPVIASNTVFSDQAASFTAAVNNGYWITANGVIVTLPATPSDYDFVILAEGVNLTPASTSVARNGKTIMGLAEDMLLDSDHFRIKLVYRATTGDWRLAL